MRIGIILLLFFVVAAAVYLNEVGVPGFLKRPLLEKLRARGVDLQFTRLRWHWHRGFVAENVRFGATQATPLDPSFSLKEAELQIDHSAMMKFQWTVDSIVLHGGQLIWPVGESNDPPQNLSLTNIQAQLRFLPEDQWALDHFTAAFAGARLQFSGSITNASAVRDWKLFKGGGGGGPPGLMKKRLRNLANALERIKFAKPPELNVALNGDARDPLSFHGLLTLAAPGATTPWGNLTAGTLLARLLAPDASNHTARVAIEVRAAAADTPWGSLTNGIMSARLSAPDLTNYATDVSLQLQADAVGTPWTSGQAFQLNLKAARDDAATNAVKAILDFQAEHIISQWAQTDDARVTVRWTHELTNAVPQDGVAEVALTGVHTRWASFGELHLTTRMDTPATGGPRHADESWAWWQGLEPYSLAWNCQLTDIHSQGWEQTNAVRFELKNLDFGGHWRAPELTLTNLVADLYGGRFSLLAAMDVATRALSFNFTSDFDIKQLAAFLPEDQRAAFKPLSWDSPPLAHCAGGIVLPAWTNRNPDWQVEVLPTLWLLGDLKLGNAAFRELSVTSVQSHFSRTNMVWNLPDAVITRPEGKIEIAHESDDHSSNFYFRVHSSIDPKIVRPFLDDDAQKGLDEFVFTETPKVSAEIRGRWHDLQSLGLKGHAALTNLTFRGEKATRFEGDFEYTNQFLNLFNGRVENGARYMSATGLGVDIPGQRIYLTNGFSTMEQTSVAHAISRKVTKTIEPYQFLQPPTVRAYGVIPLVSEVPADLHFQVEGGPFHWLKFNLDHVAAEVNWVGDRMTVTNAKAAFYKGFLTGSAAFNFAVEPGTDFSFDTTVTNTDLHALMGDLRTRTNHLEGLVSGHLQITQANSDDWKSWNGAGDVNLRDGLIWDIPIFGRFSPMLDWFGKGLGESRASEGFGNFTITNSRIHSDNLEIRSPTLRLRYHGNVDFDGKVDSTMEAEVFHDTVLVGPLLSTALMPLSKLFESKVGGTLDDPKIDQRFPVAKMLLMPFHPIRTLRDMFPSPPANGGTNAPTPLPAPPAPAP